jgi:hypothetical protein
MNKVMPEYPLNSSICSKKLLTQEECDLLINKINSLKHIWLKHPTFENTFTIGVPICSYRFLDYDTYKTVYSYYNNILETQFSNIKSLIYSFVKELFPTYNIKYGDKHGNPGFHIMFSSENYTEFIHTDTQYRRSFIPDLYDNRTTLSFTLCLNKPVEDCGLYEYDDNIESIDEYIHKVIPTERILEELNPRVIKYIPGYIYFQSGNIPHSIIQFKKLNTPRITLQGHGILETETNSIYLYF